MISRYLSSAAAGMAVTAVLLWVMQALVEMSEVITKKPGPRTTLDFVMIKRDTPLQTLKHEFTKPDEPAPTPPLVPPTEEQSRVIPVGVSARPAAPGGFRSGGNVLRYADSGLINIINAQPDYPISASTRGLEGYVIVSFDVTSNGTVENVSVVESSHRMFDKPAVKAAYRSRYKPKTVDGTPQATRGLRKLYRFEMKT